MKKTLFLLIAFTLAASPALAATDVVAGTVSGFTPSAKVKLFVTTDANGSEYAAVSGHYDGDLKYQSTSESATITQTAKTEKADISGSDLPALPSASGTGSGSGSSTGSGT